MQYLTLTQIVSIGIGKLVYLFYVLSEQYFFKISSNQKVRAEKSKNTP